MEKSELNNSTVIRNISTDQSEILKWIMELYNNDEPFECDITASELKKLEKLIKDSPAEDPYEVRVKKVCASYGIADLSQLKKSQFVHLCGKLTK